MFGFVVSAQAVKLKLCKITNERVPFASFHHEYKPRWGPKGSTRFACCFSDFDRKNVPVYYDCDIKVNGDSSLLFQYKNSQTLLNRYSVLRDEKNTIRQRLWLSVYGTPGIHYGTKIVSLRGTIKLYSGELKIFRVKFKDLKGRLSDFNKAGINILWNEKENVPRFTLKVDMGKIKHYYVGIYDPAKQDIANRELYWDKINKIFRIPKKIINNDDAYFNLFYVEKVKTEDIKVNFNVPLKWKTIAFPEKKMKLVQVKTEDKTK
jgi:hypothetical protein